MTPIRFLFIFVFPCTGSFLKAAISRTVHLRECPLPLYYYYSSEFMCPGLHSLCNSLVSLHPSLCAFCFHYSFCLHALLSLCMPLTLFPFHYIVAIIFIQRLLPLRWLDWIFLGRYLPRLSINYVGMSKDMGKRLPQLYYIMMKISYDFGFIAIGVAMAT